MPVAGKGLVYVRNTHDAQGWQICIVKGANTLSTHLDETACYRLAEMLLAAAKRMREGEDS